MIDWAMRQAPRFVVLKHVEHPFAFAFSRALMHVTNLTRELKTAAHALGFARVGVAEACALDEEGEQLRAWILAGHHGEMAYMARTQEVRIDPQHEGMLPTARSVIAMATPYATPPVKRGPGQVARYAHGRDYHNVLYRRGRKLVSFLRERGYQARLGVDSMPILERAWAVRAGLGFVGKNCCLIVPGLGSHVFLTAVVTDAELAPDAPMAPRCGSCRLCLEVCPTNALIAEQQMDARRCISYLTIEYAGSAPNVLRSQIGDWLFGCDACQDICPYNQSQGSQQGDSAFAHNPDWHVAPAEWLMTTEGQFALRVPGSAIKRAKRSGMARNAAIVLGNTREKRHLPLLEQSYREDPAPEVRDAAEWAIERILSS